MFSHLLIKSMYSTLALLTEKLHDLKLESQQRNGEKYFEWRICLGWKILLRNDWVTEYMVHSCGSSLSFIVPSVGNQITVDYETNLGNLTPQDAATHVVAQLKNQLLNGQHATNSSDIKILKREIFSLTKQSSSSSSSSSNRSHLTKREGFQIWVQIKYLSHTFTRRIVAFNLQDDDIIIFQQDAPSDTPINIDFGNNIISCIEPHDSKSKGQLVLYRKNVRMMLPDAHYEIKEDSEFTFRAELTPHTGTVIEGISMNPCHFSFPSNNQNPSSNAASSEQQISPAPSQQITLDQLEIQLSSYYGKDTRRINIGPHQCALVSYESQSSMGHRYKFYDIALLHQNQPYIITAFTKPDRFDAFEDRLFDCIRTLTFYSGSVHNDYLEYYNIEYQIHIKLPCFMTVYEDVTGEDAAFVAFKSENFVTTLSRTSLAKSVGAIDELQEKILYDIGQSFTRMEQVEIKQTRMLTLGGPQQPLSAFQVTHVFVDHVNQTRFVYLNTYVLSHDKRTVFRIQSSVSQNAMKAETLRLFVNMHRSFNVLPSPNNSLKAHDTTISSRSSLSSANQETSPSTPQTVSS